MVTLTFHWAWILIVILVIVGIACFIYFSNDDRGGIGSGIRSVFGCFLFVLCILIAAVLGGIFIW